MDTRISQEDLFMRVASTIAKERSTCLRKKVGAVLARGSYIVATGYNGAPKGLDHCTEVGCALIDGHCVRSIHAEENVILQAASEGVSTSNTTLYITLRPCFRCQMRLYSCGITTIKYLDDVYSEQPQVSTIVNELSKGLTMIKYKLGENNE